jgi:asparagine synthase (glutamine-hydrolysing)
MSGFAVVYNKQDRSELEILINKIRHRGPFVSGKIQIGRVLMAQNYLKADIPLTQGDAIQIATPVSDTPYSDHKICYDGQIGNWQALVNSQCPDIFDGPFREERLILQLYRQYGSQMLEYLDDAIFALVISDGESLFAARDLLGIKTLYYGRKNGTLYFASELKSLLEITGEAYEFPAGHYMSKDGELTQFAKLPESPPSILHTDITDMMQMIRSIIQRSFNNRVNFISPTGCLLSGGIDSSVVAWLASEACRKKFGKNTRLKTFALGVGESEDIQYARMMAGHIKSDHHELMVDLDQILELLPDVIYHLESFDPSLVRSAVSNFLISRYAKEKDIEVLLSGEGGDEIFCGYLYLKGFATDELFARQMECLGFLHNNAALRLDRMNLSNSVRVVAPLISGELLNYALSIPMEYKLKPDGEQKVEKWIFRKTFENILPKDIVWRLKQEFSQGSGSADILPQYFENEIADDELEYTQAYYPIVRSKEELFYFRIFRHHFGTGKALETVGQWISL